MTLALIESTLFELIPPSEDRLYSAARYSLEGGKRLRPMLTLATLETFGESFEKGLIPACAIEMIHAYSMIHDDLPCMDNDDFRRGRPTLHRAFSESLAVLTGDFLLTYAFEVIGKAENLSDAQKNQLVVTLAKRSGGEGMIGGQILDLEGATSTNLTAMHLKKTGALITAALEFGGIIANAPLKPLQLLGETIGLAYQLVDDFIDGDGACITLGKQKTQHWIEQLFEKALSILKTFPQKSEHLKEIFEQMILRKV